MNIQSKTPKKVFGFGETLADEIKPVVTNEIFFEHRNETKSLAFLNIFVPSRR